MHAIAKIEFRRGGFSGLQEALGWCSGNRLVSFQSLRHAIFGNKAK